jgi:5-methylcytosine-specific restriction enzyme subunit McrC
MPNQSRIAKANRMSKITVFEHQSLRIGEGEFDEKHLEALEKYYGNGDKVKYFSLIHNGVKFNQHVGVLQVGSVVYEVLPKIDKASDDIKWRKVLIGMLRAVGNLEVYATSNASLKFKRNSILDLYFELFIKEVEYLLHSGLAKQYRKEEGNVTALKGSIKFGKHIQQNLIHQERFYTAHCVYDVEHKLHFILYKTLRLIGQMNTNALLHSRICSLLLNFPQMPNITANEKLFETIVFSRKTAPYKKAIEISKMLLLNYHPDVVQGRNNVLALMFDMNKLWESFIAVSLKRHTKYGVSTQRSKLFWKNINGKGVQIKPDIVIEGNNQRIVLDTKWKNIDGYAPSSDDLQQMFAYLKRFDAEKVALVYPSLTDKEIKGEFVKGGETCSIIPISIHFEIKTFQEEIAKTINNFFEVK